MKVLAVALMTSIAGFAPAWAADCPRQDALGTSRILKLDPATYPRVGLKSFPPRRVCWRRWRTNASARRSS
jgi:hypothetical protein